jgi:hypothetical protein
MTSHHRVPVLLRAGAPLFLPIPRLREPSPFSARLRARIEAPGDPRQ